MQNTKSKNEYAVVIPAYKKAFDDDEYCCVKAFFEVLTGEKYFVVPEGLDTVWYREKFPAGKYKTFPDRFFTGTKGYNKLLLSEDFYEIFSDFEYILIAQPDAALWSKEDRIPEFIGKGFDYIGAPWIPERRIWEWTFPRAILVESDKILERARLEKEIQELQEQLDKLKKSGDSGTTE